jgi:hypothetical protein
MYKKVFDEREKKELRERRESTILAPNKEHFKIFFFAKAKPRFMVDNVVKIPDYMY